MKTFLVVVVIATALYFWQRQSQQTVTPAPVPTAAQSPGAAAPARPVSEHNWAKHSLDRAHEVADQVQQTRASNEQP